MRQDQIDRGERPGVTTPESIELAKAKKRIRQLETEIEILKAASKLLGEDRRHPKGFTRRSTRSSRPATGPRSVVDFSASVAPATTDIATDHCRRLRCRRQWLTGLIREVHTASRQTYGSRRVHAELTLGMHIQVSERLVAVLMSNAQIAGQPDAGGIVHADHGVQFTS